MTESTKSNNPFLWMLQPDVALAAVDRTLAREAHIFRPLDTRSPPPGTSFQKADPIGAWYRAARAQKPGREIKLSGGDNQPAESRSPIQGSDKPAPAKKIIKPRADWLLNRLVACSADEAIEKFRRRYVLKRLNGCEQNVAAFAREVGVTESHGHNLLRLARSANTLTSPRPNRFDWSAVAKGKKVSTLDELLELPYKEALSAFSQYYLTRQFEWASGDITRMATAINRTHESVKESLERAGIDRKACGPQKN